MIAVLKIALFCLTLMLPGLIHGQTEEDHRQFGEDLIIGLTDSNAQRIADHLLTHKDAVKIISIYNKQDLSENAIHNRAIQMSNAAYSSASKAYRQALKELELAGYDRSSIQLTRVVYEPILNEKVVSGNFAFYFECDNEEAGVLLAKDAFQLDNRWVLLNSINLITLTKEWGERVCECHAQPAKSDTSYCNYLKWSLDAFRAASSKEDQQLLAPLVESCVSDLRELTAANVVQDIADELCTCLESFMQVVETDNPDESVEDYSKAVDAAQKDAISCMTEVKDKHQKHATKAQVQEAMKQSCPDSYDLIFGADKE